MGLMLGDMAPDFTAETTHGRINFHEWLGDSWGILFSHPADFTPVCTTEFGAMARLNPAFEERGVKIIGLSTDDLETHRRWIRDVEETQRIRVTFPIIADPERNVADLYRMLYAVMPKDGGASRAVRSVFIIGPDKSIRLTLTYPDSTGRNFQEILRVVDSMQLADRCEVATPADWKRGDDCLIPDWVPAQEVAWRYPLGSMEVKPYLRYTPEPNPRMMAATLDL